MFKGSEDSSQSEQDEQSIPILQKSLILDNFQSAEHLVCSICFHILWNPVVCGSLNGCHNSFCQDCITTWIHKSSKLCPTCKKTFISNQPPPILTSLLHTLKFNCPNYINGCQSHINYIDFSQHTKICPYKIFRCRGCRGSVPQKDYQYHILNCQQFIVECGKCKLKLKRVSLNDHKQIACFSQQINKAGNRVSALEQKIEQLNNSLQKLTGITNCFLSGQALQLNIQLYTTFNQHFTFPNPSLIKPSFNQQKQRFDFLHFYVVNPIYRDSIASVKWSIKINKMIGNILLGFCSSMGLNSIDLVINKYGDLKRKEITQSKYRLIKKVDNGFNFSCGDILRFKYGSLSKCIRICNQTKRLDMILTDIDLSQLGQCIYIFYSMDTLNDSLSFI